MNFRRVACLLAVCMMLLSSICLAAEHMEFVDANGSTGYYVDVDTIAPETVVENDVPRTLWNADVAVVRADINRSFIYAMRFDPDNKTYQIFHSEVQRYDTKDVLQSSDTVEAPHAYAPSSPMNEIVQFIISTASSSAKE